jgi:hypothetical protein
MQTPEAWTIQDQAPGPEYEYDDPNIYPFNDLPLKHTLTHRLQPTCLLCPSHLQNWLSCEHERSRKYQRAPSQLHHCHEMDQTPQPPLSTATRRTRNLLLRRP